MKVTISKREDSSITEDITLELAKYTIFAGENNSGKTNLIRAIKDHKDFGTYKQIFIPAEHIQPQGEELKSSAITTSFSKLLKTILGPIFSKNILKELVDNFNGSDDKNNFIYDVNRLLEDIGVAKTKFDVKIAEDEFNENLIIKITKAFVKDLYETDVNEVDLDRIGMGIQRLIVAVLIRYYEEKKIEKNEKVLIIFEEPEVYLHPKLKKGLYESLLKLSTDRENTMVLITTHDPYFIELGKGQKIYHVFRDNKKKDATMVEPMESDGLLGYKSESEINYLIFGIPSKTYFIELYETLMAEYETIFTDTCTYDKLNPWIKKQDDESKVKIEFTNAAKTNPKVSKLRHMLSHPREETVNISEEEINNRIEELEKLIPIMRAERK